MKYQQPYGVSDPNASYLNGNPSTGTMGSIPPAASIEYDMREIIEVISRANSRSYVDFTGAPCAAAADTDLQQLRKAIEGFVRSWQAQFSDLIDSFVTFTVHGTSPDFADLHAAMHYLSKYKITQHGRVILQLRGNSGAGAATIYTYNQSIIFDHPQNHRIFVLGAPLRSPIPRNRLGYTLTGSSAGARAADTTANLSMLRQKFATELRFTNGTGIEILGANLGSLDGLLISSTGTPFSAGVMISAPSTEFHISHLFDATIPAPPENGVAVTGFDQHGFLIVGNSTGYGLGFPLVSFGNGGHGFSVNALSKFQPIEECLSYSNGQDGYSAGNLSTLWMDVPQCEAAYNGVNGLTATSQSIGEMSGSTIWGNGSRGVAAVGNSYVNAGSCVFSVGGVYNAVGDAYADRMSIISVGAVTGHRNLWSPALVTFGNQQSWIHT